MPKDVRFWVIGDLHGTPAFVPPIDNFDAIICVGDLCSISEIRKAIFSNSTLLKQRRDLEWWDIVGRKKSRTIVKNAFESGVETLRTLEAYGLPIFLTPGNTELVNLNLNSNRQGEGWIYPRILKESSLAIDCHLAVTHFRQIPIFGYGLSSGPGDLRRRAEKEAVKQISKVIAGLERSGIFVSHNVPYGSSLGLVTLESSPAFGQNVGDKVTRRIVDKHGIPVCLCGHVHETQGVDMISDTLCVNSGFGAIGQSSILYWQSSRAEVRLFEQSRELKRASFQI